MDRTIVIGLFVLLIAGLCGCRTAPWNKSLQLADFYYADAGSRQDGAGKAASSGDETPLAAQVKVFNETLTAAREKPMEHAASAGLAEQGIVLVNMLCYDYFRQAAEARQQTRYKRDLASNVSTVVGALLNLDGASSFVTGGMTALSGGLDTNYQSLDKHLVPAPDLAAVRKIVASGMDLQANEMRAINELTFSKVSVRLMRLAETCDFNGIRALVDQSATEGAKNVKSDGEGNVMVSNAALPLSRYATAKALQDAGFQHLATCDWGKAEQAFRDAEKAYPQFQASHEYASALAAAKGAKKQAVLDVRDGRDYMPAGVKSRLEKDCK